MLQEVGKFLCDDSCRHGPCVAQRYLCGLERKESLMMHKGGNHLKSTHLGERIKIFYSLLQLLLFDVGFINMVGLKQSETGSALKQIKNTHN